MPEPQGIALSLSNRRAVLKDDPEYNRLLLALRDEQPEALQDDELAHLQTLSAPNFRTQNDPVADRARLGVSDDAPYTSTMGRTLLGGTGAKMSAAPPLSKWDEFTGTLGRDGAVLGDPAQLDQVFAEVCAIKPNDTQPTTFRGVVHMCPHHAPVNHPPGVGW